ncbi:hypothetical protein HAX54_012248 [Datura stramonium]|uniref:DUF4408 domain-containing protein n=1 Tax=Datura stramonium TaxID=4076 RepID=A0ABS8Y2E7_DATST|nr:hypothetical protein [Datura stramonium]
MIECVASWFTPTVLFCLLNLMIGTIFITSSLKSEKKQPQFITRSPSLLHRVKSFNFSFFPDPFSSITHDLSDDTSPQLDPTPSLLQRIKSINLSDRLDPIPNSVAQYADDPHEEQAVQIANGSHVTIRSKSATCPAEVPTRTMLKCASEKKMPVAVAEVDLRGGPATTRETASFGEDEAVDRRADDFINKFRQQLKLQRLDSILRYKEMLNRGVGR